MPTAKRAAPPKRPAAADDETRKDAVLDAALALAAEAGWHRLHLHHVGARLGVPLVDLYRDFADLDAVGDRLFARADRAMMAAGAAPGFAELPVRERLHRAMMAWFEALADHRDAARAILGYRLSPSHLHHQAALVVALSRHVQWLREAAGLDAAPPRREREEVYLTLLFLAALGRWFADRSPGQERTHAFVGRRLAAPLTRLLWP